MPSWSLLYALLELALAMLTWSLPFSPGACFALLELALAMPT
jgi:hypothetical protein